MNTKDNPSKFDGYRKARHDEPTFTLLARDPQFQKLIEEWANQRERDVSCGLEPPADMEMVAEARQLAVAGAEWRRKNNGKWHSN